MKRGPQRWQEEKAQFELIITYELRVFDSVVEGLFRCPQNAARSLFFVTWFLLFIYFSSDIQKRKGPKTRPVHVINIDTKDYR